MRLHLVPLLILLCTAEHLSPANTLLPNGPTVEHLVRQHVVLERQKRYLLYPSGDPARVQMIIGVGIPVDLDDQSVTIGYVIKMLFHVPQEPADYATNMFNSASLAKAFNRENTVVIEGNHTKEIIAEIHNNKLKNNIQDNDVKEVDDNDNERDVEKDENEEVKVTDPEDASAEDDESKDTKENFTTKYPCKNMNDKDKQNGNNKNIKCYNYLEMVQTDKDVFNKIKLETWNNNETKEEVEELKERQERDSDKEKNAKIIVSNVSNNNKENGKMVGEWKADDNLPYKYEFNNDPKVTRWDIYKIFENMMEQKGYDGRSCMLRTICESSETPFTHKNGVLGELFHILLLPSATREILSHPTDKDYHTAEARGKMEDVVCQEMYPDCEESLLELFSEVGIDNFWG